MEVSPVPQMTLKYCFLSQVLMKNPIAQPGYFQSLPANSFIFMLKKQFRQSGYLISQGNLLKLLNHKPLIKKLI
jgi:hypothetical protein